MAVAQDEVRPQGRLGQQRPDHPWRKVVEDHWDNASAAGVAVHGVVSRVPLRLCEEARAANLARDLRARLRLVPV